MKVPNEFTCWTDLSSYTIQFIKFAPDPTDKLDYIININQLTFVIQDYLQTIQPTHTFLDVMLYKQDLVNAKISMIFVRILITPITPEDSIISKAIKQDDYVLTFKQFTDSTTIDGNIHSAIAC